MGSASDTHDTPDLRALFDSCDKNKSGLIEDEDLRAICGDLGEDEVVALLKQLDRSDHGAISFEDFAAGYDELISMMSAGRSRAVHRLSQDFTAGRSTDLGSSSPFFHLQKQPSRDQEFVASLGEDLYLLSCQERIFDLYRDIRQVSSAQDSNAVSKGDADRLLSSFEDLVVEILRDVREAFAESARLEQYLLRERADYDKRIHELELETEHQFQRFEQKIRDEEKTRVLLEAEALQRQMHSEVDQLRSRLRSLEEAEKQHSDSLHAEASEIWDLKRRLEHTISENRRLQQCLTDRETSLALARSELNSLRLKYEQSANALAANKKCYSEVMENYEALQHQLEMLREANKHLNDANDDMRATIESSRRGDYASSHVSRMSYRRESLISRYLDQAQNFRLSLAEEMGNDSGEIFTDPFMHDDLDSGHGTWRDSDTVHTDNHQLRTMDSSAGTIVVSDDSEIIEKTEASVGNCSVRSRGSVQSSSSVGTSISQKCQKQRAPISPDSFAANANSSLPSRPERMYRIVLCGDSSVGKSSFIIRLCENQFEVNTQITLGVDFQTKSLDVDGHHVALQLWDTAGQERFRSIAKSYFRRADGAILVYDCCAELTFRNVRAWVECIEDASGRPPVLMIIANKTDLRPQLLGDRPVVPESAGRKLAQEYDAIFYEVSAKTGENILEAVTELSRKLRRTEDQQAVEEGMKLHEEKAKSKDDSLLSCCKF